MPEEPVELSPNFNQDFKASRLKKNHNKVIKVRRKKERQNRKKSR